MYYFIADETNSTQSRTTEFFIYGGLIASDEQLSTITKRISEIRAQHAFHVNDSLKFDTRARPEHITQATYTQAKNDVIQACYGAGAKFIAYLVLHDIAQKDNLTEFALNTVLYSFNGRFLAERDSQGIVVIDRLPNDRAYSLLRSLFQNGLTLTTGAAPYFLDRVLMLATTCDGASHISSAVDIVLGAFRYVVNSQGKSVVGDVERALFPAIARMMYARVENGAARANEYGFILRPLLIKHPPYRERYDLLRSYLGSLLSEAPGH